MSEETKTNEVPGTAEGTPAGAEPKTFDDILSDKAYQAEFDRRVSKAVETAKSKWNETVEETVSSKIKEAAKLAKMSADEKAKFEREKQEADYNARLAEVTKRELKAEAKEQLAENGFPSELADTLNYADADSCKKSMEAVTKAFGAAVEKAVNERLKGKAPRGGTSGAPDYNDMSDEEYYASTIKK